MSDFHFTPVTAPTDEDLVDVVMQVASLDDAKQFVRKGESSDIPRRTLAAAATKAFEDGVWEHGLYHEVSDYIDSCSMVHDRGWTIGFVAPEESRFTTDRAIPVRVMRDPRGHRVLRFGWRDFADKETPDFTINGVGVRVGGVKFTQADSGDFERDRKSWDAYRRVGSHEEVTETARKRVNDTLEEYSNWINENHSDLVIDGISKWAIEVGAHAARVRVNQARDIEHLGWVVDEWRQIADELANRRCYIAGVVDSPESPLVHMPTLNRVGEVEIARLVLTSEIRANGNGVVIGYIGVSPSQGGPREMSGEPWVVPKSCVAIGHSVAQARANRGL